MRPQAKLTILAVGHVLGSPFWFTRDGSPFGFNDVVFLGILFAQGSLLAFWLAMDSEHRRSVLALSLMLGIEALLVMQLGWGEHDYYLIFLVVVATAAILFGAFFALSARYGVNLQYLANLPTGFHDGQRFSIRHLFYFTGVVSVVLGLRNLAPTFADLPAKITVIGVCLFVVPFISIWGALSVTRPLAPCLSAIVLAGFVGLTPPLYFDHYENVPWFWPTVFSLQSLLCVGSLLVVRSNGYRLVTNNQARGV